MSWRSARLLRFVLPAALCITAAGLHAQAPRLPPPLNRHALAKEYFAADAPWFEENIPFFDVDDADILRTYYYRWQLYRSHLRQIGNGGVTVTEFLPDVSWARHPYTDLNDSAAFHIREGRWLRNPAIVESLIDHLYTGGGNDRHFTEWVAAATLDFLQVTGDNAVALRNLPSMRNTFELWDDHLDRARNLYWTEPLPDATEYTVSSIDASGAGFTDHPSADESQNGFRLGYAYRPSINSYQFANAQAIAQFAAQSGLPAVAAQYRERAEGIRTATLAQLWNPSQQHFMDVYQRSTPTVTAGQFIRNRELVGYTPWMFGLVDGTGAATYNTAWKHMANTDELLGRFGLRTTEPAYPKYMVQYRYDKATGHVECQWNGPSWPFQTSQVLMGMARLLHSGAALTAPATRDVFVAGLRQYTRQHITPDGTLDLQEDYNPDTGAPIVGMERSHHYNHSTYNDLVINGLVGIVPQDSDNSLVLDPLLPTAAGKPIRYFAVTDLRYHGRDLAVMYDSDGTRYHRGAGMSVFCDGHRVAGPAPLQRLQVTLCPARVHRETRPVPVDIAVNVFEAAPGAFQQDVPTVAASSTAAGSNAYAAIDGRMWFFPEIANGWSPAAADTAPQLELDLRTARQVGRIELAFLSTAGVAPPSAVVVEGMEGTQWRQLAVAGAPIGNGVAEVRFPAVKVQKLRLHFHTAGERSFRLIEVSAFAK